MAKRVYFCFHYQDVCDFRANVVRNHWLLKPDREDAGFFDWSLWEKAEKTGTTALKRLINGGLERTSTTCVLIGSETYLRPWVRYEIMKSHKRGNSIFGVHINSIRGKNRQIKVKGPNPFNWVGITYSDSGVTRTLFEIHNREWKKYSEIDDSAVYQGTEVPDKYRGKGFNFGHFYPVYDWVDDDGYNNFATWVK